MAAAWRWALMPLHTVVRWRQVARPWPCSAPASISAIPAVTRAAPGHNRSRCRGQRIQSRDTTAAAGTVPAAQPGNQRAQRRRAGGGGEPAQRLTDHRAHWRWSKIERCLRCPTPCLIPVAAVATSCCARGLAGGNPPIYSTIRQVPVRGPSRRRGRRRHLAGGGPAAVGLERAGL